MFISVITPCYNSSKTLLRTYQSLRGQTCKDFEWILIDDCSTDNGLTRELIRNISNEAPFPVKYYFFKENSFASKSISKGCELAVGSYIGILDHDDQYLPQTIEKVKDLADRFAMRQHIAGVCGRCFDLQGNLIGKKFERDVFATYDGVVRYKMGFFDEMINFTKTSVLKEVASNIKPGYTYGYLWYTIGKTYQFVFTNEVLRIYDTEVETSYTNATKEKVRYPYNLAEWIVFNLDAYSPYLKFRPIHSLRQAMYVQYLRTSYKLQNLPRPENSNVRLLLGLSNLLCPIRKLIK